MMRSKASLKFNNLHPESHLKFQNIIRNARLRKNSLEEDLSGNTSDEVSNMLKNKYLSKFREKDDCHMVWQTRYRLPHGLANLLQNATWFGKLVTDCHMVWQTIVIFSPKCCEFSSTSCY